MSVDCGEEYPDVHTAGYRRARIEHVCSACKETIRRGDRYHYDFIVWEGDPETCKRCMRCDAIYQHLCSVQDPFSETTPDWRLNCGHSYREVHECEPPPEIAALAFALPHEMQGER